jgi:hypothetical protein
MAAHKEVFEAARMPRLTGPEKERSDATTFSFSVAIRKW